MKKTAKKLNDELKKTNEAQQYFALKEALKKDEYVLSLLQVIQQTQKEAKECLKENDMENYKIKKQTLNILQDEFIRHPLIHNYIICKHDLFEILEQIVHILSDN